MPLEYIKTFQKSRKQPAGPSRLQAVLDLAKFPHQRNLKMFMKALKQDGNAILKMHGVMLSTRPGLVYWNGATVEIIHRVRALRRQGTPAFFTIDAGPQVKVVTESAAIEAVRRAIADIPGVASVEPRLVYDVLLDVPGLREPATGRLISVPDSG